jgi:hypothetical protein
LGPELVPDRQGQAGIAPLRVSILACNRDEVSRTKRPLELLQGCIEGLGRHLAGSIGRWRACQDGWTGEPEHSPALSLLEHEEYPAAVFRRLSDRAAAIVKANLAEIVAAA